MRLWDILADWFFPPKCILCRKVLTKEQTDLCPACRTDVTPFPEKAKTIPHVKSWCALWHYDGMVRNSIIRFKFQKTTAYAESYGRLLAMHLLTHGKDFDLITWVPVSPMRKRERGYDQTELIARQVALSLGIEPVQLLKKVRHNRPQSGIRGYAKRKANVLGAYQAVDPGIVAGKQILLLDDIITTGVTVSECARVLLTAGAKEVHCAAVAAASNHPNEQVKS